MITMENIIRDGHPTLRKVAEEVTLPLSKEDVETGEEMLTFLKNSQDPVKAEELHLRGGVGLAAPQINVSKRFIALHVPDPDPDKGIRLSTVMYNPKILSHSVQDTCLADGEGCLSVDREIPGYVVRHARITVSYVDKNNEVHKVKLKGYDAIVVQHEIDHLNGVMFYDHIDKKNPFKLQDGVLVIE